jgi:hypothetical protein
MTRYRFTSSALSELREAALYFEQQQNGLGAKFLDEIDATIERILLFPHALASDVCANKALPNASLSLRSPLSSPA